MSHWATLNQQGLAPDAVSRFPLLDHGISKEDGHVLQVFCHICVLNVNLHHLANINMCMTIHPTFDQVYSVWTKVLEKSTGRCQSQSNASSVATGVHLPWEFRDDWQTFDMTSASWRAAVSIINICWSLSHHTRLYYSAHGIPSTLLI